MKNLKRLLKQPLWPIPTSLAIFILAVAILGFADATYLALEHFKNVIPPCAVGGCETVLTSVYSTIWGIPVSFIGSVYYLIIAVGIFSYLDSKRVKILKWTLLLTIFGFLASLYFFYLQAFVLKAYCLYCLGSALTSTILFITAIGVFSKSSVADKLGE